jgi:hypothetical protein
LSGPSLTFVLVGAAPLKLFEHMFCMIVLIIAITGISTMYAVATCELTARNSLIVSLILIVCADLNSEFLVSSCNLIIYVVSIVKKEFSGVMVIVCTYST